MKKMFFTTVFTLFCFFCFAQTPTKLKQKTTVGVVSNDKAKIQALNTKLTQLLEEQTKQLKQAQANASQIEELRRQLDNAQKQAKPEDRMGNFEIQRLMSAFNQMETLSSNVLKKSSETASGVIGKID
jgi:TolA-binding protein